MSAPQLSKIIPTPTIRLLAPNVSLRKIPSNPEIHPALLSPQDLSHDDNNNNEPRRRKLSLTRKSPTPTPRVRKNSSSRLPPSPRMSPGSSPRTQLDPISILLDKIEALEILLNSLEVQLKSETNKRAPGSGIDEQDKLDAESYKELEKRYKEVLEEIALTKESLSKLNYERRNSSSDSEPEDSTQKRGSFGNAILLFKQITRPSPPTKTKRSHSQENTSEPTSEIETPELNTTEMTCTLTINAESPQEESEENKLTLERIKQLIEQKYSSQENVKSPFLSNLRAKRQTQRQEKR